MKKRILSALLVLVMLFGLVGCNDGAGSTEESGIKTYTIELKTNGGKTFEGIEIHVFEDSSMNDLVSVGKTDANGIYSFEAEYSKDYVAVLKNMPAGYNVEASYALTETTLSLVFEAKLLAVGDVTSALKLGGVAADMTVKTADGTTYTISELLKTKEAVVLNFWYEGCDPCRAEFPYMEEAYKEYSDKIEILAINPYDGDDASVAAYKANMGLTFPMAKADAAYTDAYGVTAFPTTVVIDRYGTIGFKHTGSVPNADTFRNLFAYFTGDDYKQSTVKNIDDLIPVVEGGDGSKEYPFEKYETEFEATVAAGAEVYYQMYRVDGMILEIADPNAYVIFNDKKYEAVDGKVSLALTTPDTYTPAVFVIGNKAAESKNFAVSLSFIQGTSGNPFVMNLGNFTTKVEAGNASGIYYTYTATENGTLTLDCTKVTAGVNYDFTMYNTVSSALRNLSTDGDGDSAVSITVNAGDEVQITIGVLPNDDNEIPAAEFTFKASFKAGEGTGIDPNATVDYKVTVVDKKGKGVANAVITFSSESVDNVVMTSKTDATGVATITLPGGNYIVTIAAPSGYTEDTTEYIVTKYDYQLKVTIDKTTVVTKTYKVKVVDESGKAIKDAGVTVDGNYVKTGADGFASFTLEEGDYDVSVSVSGYSSDGKTYKFSGGTTELTVTMKKNAAPVKEVEYKVTVTTYDNKAVTGVKVQFKAGQAVIAEVEVNASGVATTKLNEGNYTAVVVDDEYGSGNVSLTAKNTSAKVIAAKKIDANAGIEEYFGTVYPLEFEDGESSLAVYVDLIADGDNYFLFDHQKAGEYEFKSTGEDTKLAPCGSAAFVYTPYYESNVYTTEVKSGMIGGNTVISVTGGQGTVIIVTRKGNANETIYREYEGTKNPTDFTLTTGGDKLTYVDVAASKFDIVLGSDGYYHKDSANGPIVYVNLGKNAPYLSLQTMIQGAGNAGGTPLVSYTTENGQQVRTDYTNFMISHFECMDTTYGVYPLTEDLKYVLQKAGDHNGWWDKDKAGGYYLFSSVSSLNADIAWMFACCYVE